MHCDGMQHQYVASSYMSPITDWQFYWKINDNQQTTTKTEVTMWQRHIFSVTAWDQLNAILWPTCWSNNVTDIYYSLLCHAVDVAYLGLGWKQDGGYT